MVTAAAALDRVPHGRRRWPAIYAATVLLCGIAYSTASSAGLRQSMFALVAVSSVVAIVVGVKWYKPTNTFSWICLAGASSAFVGGAILRQDDTILGQSTVFFTDSLTIAGYAAAGIGIFTWVRERNPGTGRGALIDAVLIAASALLLSWIALISPLIGNGPTGPAITNGLFPVIDAAMLTLAAHLLFGSDTANRSLRWLGVTYLGLLIGDLGYSISAAYSVEPPTVVLDGMFLISFAALGLAVLDPSMTKMSDRQIVPPARRRQRLASIVILLLVCSALPVIGNARNTADMVIRSLLLASILICTYWRSENALTRIRRGENQAVYLATHDAHTDLPNRNLMMQAVQRHQHLKSSTQQVSIMFIDLDNFKIINDSYGHRVGDELIAAAADRLRSAVELSDTVIRYAGDEFIIVTHLGRAATEGLARKLIDRIADPFMLSVATVFVTTSIGIARSGSIDSQEDLDDLVREADTAMYEAKSRGPAEYAFFDRSLHEKATRAIEITTALRGALARDEFTLHYQPIVDTGTGHTFGYEALLRWKHAGIDRAPVEFIPIAESTGMIDAIGAWVLERAISDLAAWRRSGQPHLIMTVNVSARQFRDESMPDLVADTLRRHGIPGSALALEVTETVIIEDTPATIAVLDRITAQGIALVLDDFGTGYSSLSRLHSIAIGIVKIDRSFIAELTHSESAVSLVTAIKAMCDALGMSAVAEGVETLEQAAILESLGCHLVQGFYFGRPAPVEQWR